MRASWPYLAVSSALQVGYSAFLVRAYRYGDLGSVYPIVRGSVPLLVTIGGLLLMRSPETLKAVTGGIQSLLAYTAMISALALGPIGPVSALRETSVVFALVIGRVFLGEPFTLRRLFACAAVASGAFLVGYTP